MSQDYTVDCFAAGNEAQSDLANMEKNFECLRTCFSGASAPANPVAGMLWLDTTNHILKVRNEANNAWLNVYNLSTGRVPDADACGGITITAGTGLSGGGALSANRTLSLATGAIGASHMVSYTVGEYIEVESMGTDYTASTSWTFLKGFYIPRAGTVRVRWFMSLSPGTYPYQTAQTQVYLNGSATGDIRATDSTLYYNEADDIVVTAGSTIDIYGRVVNGDGTQHCNVSNACICCGNPISASKTFANI